MATPVLDPTATLVAGTFYPFIAPTGTALPTDVGTGIGQGIDDAFIPLGYTGNDGSKFKVDTTTKDLFAHQSLLPLRTIIESQTSTIEIPLLEWTDTGIKTAFNGGSITSTANGHIYTPPAVGTLTEYSIVCDIVDGNKRLRIIAQRAIIVGSVEASLVKNDFGTLPIVANVLAPTTAPSAWQLAGTDEFLTVAS